MYIRTITIAFCAIVLSTILNPTHAASLTEQQARIAAARFVRGLRLRPQWRPNHPRTRWSSRQQTACGNCKPSLAGSPRGTRRYRLLWCNPRADVGFYLEYRRIRFLVWRLSDNGQRAHRESPRLPFLTAFQGPSARAARDRRRGDRMTDCRMAARRSRANSSHATSANEIRN